MQLLTGLQVVTLVTGAVETPFWNNIEGGHVGIPDSSPYQPIKSRVEDMMVGNTKPTNQHTAERWAKAVANDLLKPNPPSHVRRGLYATVLLIVSWLSPSWLLDWGFTQSTHLGKLKSILDSQESKKRQ